MTTSPRPWLNKKSLLFVSLISQLPSVWYHWSFYSYSPSILLVWFKWHCSLLAPLIIYHLVIVLAISRNIYQIHFHLIKVFHKALVFFSLSTPLHLAHLYLIHMSNIISMPMTLNSLSLFLPLTSLSTSLISRLPSTMYQLGCQQTSCLSINLKLNSCLLVFLNSFPKFLILVHVLSCSEFIVSIFALWRAISDARLHVSKKLHTVIWKELKPVSIVVFMY